MLCIDLDQLDYVLEDIEAQFPMEYFPLPKRLHQQLRQLHEKHGILGFTYNFDDKDDTRLGVMVKANPESEVEP